MKVAVTGADGFIAKNLMIWLGEVNGVDVLPINRRTSDRDFIEILSKADFVFHLAGANRPAVTADFMKINRDMTERLVKTLEETSNLVPILLSSSTQAEKNNDYGVSKLAGERVVEAYSKRTGIPAYIYRLPNILGNGVVPTIPAVATFCQNAVDGISTLHDPEATVTLCYIDDLCSSG